MPKPLNDNQIAVRGMALVVSVVLAFALAAALCFGAGLLVGTIVLAALGWRLLGHAVTPFHLNVAAGVAVATALVTLWAS